MGLENLDCFRCEQRGHIAAECDQLKPAATYSEHLARIDTIRMRFLEFEITPEQKYRLIEAENDLWHRRKT